MNINNKLYHAIEKSFPKIKSFFTDEMLTEFLHTPMNHLEKYNAGLGTMIRLRSLRPSSSLYQKFIACGFTDKDEMTMKIITDFHKYITEKNEI